MIERSAFDLVGCAPSGRELVAEIELRALAATDKYRTVLELKPALLDSAQHAGFFQILHALRQQAFADAKARELFALEHQYPASLATKQRRRQRSGGPGTDYYHIEMHIDLVRIPN